MATGYEAVTNFNDYFNHDTRAAAAEIYDALGDISDFEVWGNQVLIAVYCPPAETKSGFLIGSQTTLESVWQGKVGLIIKIGPDAFPETAATFGGNPPKPGDWVYHCVQEQTLQLSLKGAASKKLILKSPRGEEEEARKWGGWPVRLVSGSSIYGRVKHPEIVT
jgi:hypothetical protein